MNSIYETKEFSNRLLLLNYISELEIKYNVTYIVSNLDNGNLGVIFQLTKL